MTLDELYSEVFNGHFKHLNSKWVKHVARLYKREIQAQFGKQEVDKIRPLDIRNWHQSRKRTPYQANRALSVFKKIFNFGEEMELTTVNPAKFIKHFSERKREAMLNAEQIKRLERFCLDDGSIHAKYVLLLLWTGSRPEALLAMKAEQVSILKGGVGVYVHKGKNTDKTGKMEKVFIPKKGISLLNTITDAGEYFPFKCYSYFWNKCKQACDLEGLVLRDLRRTWATQALEKGVDLQTVSELMNHQNIHTTTIYAKILEKNKIDAITKIGA